MNVITIEKRNKGGGIEYKQVLFVAAVSHFLGRKGVVLS
jgi:hypothetical protein